MSSARFRSLYRRRQQAYEAVYHFSANPVRQVVTGFSAARATETSPVPSPDERFRAAIRREMASGTAIATFTMASTERWKNSAGEPHPRAYTDRLNAST